MPWKILSSAPQLHDDGNIDPNQACEVLRSRDDIIFSNDDPPKSDSRYLPLYLIISPQLRQVVSNVAASVD